MESMAMPMQMLVAGAEMISTGTPKIPIPPSMQRGTRPRLRIIAAAPRMLRATIQAMTANKTINQNRPVTRLDATVFDHPNVKRRFRAIRGDKAPGDALVFRFFHDLEHMFLAHKKGEGPAVAFSNQERERNHGPDPFVIFERGLQDPHLPESVTCVQFAAIRSGNDQCERI